MPLNKKRSLTFKLQYNNEDHEFDIRLYWGTRLLYRGSACGSSTLETLRANKLIEQYVQPKKLVFEARFPTTKMKRKKNEIVVNLGDCGSGCCLAIFHGRSLTSSYFQCDEKVLQRLQLLQVYRKPVWVSVRRPKRAYAKSPT